MDLLGPDAFVDIAEPPSLADGEIHLWFFPQFKRGARGSQVNPLLAHYLNVAPSALRIDRNAHGKPFVIGEPLHFNLSHSGDALLIAVSRDQPLGVDIETSRRERRIVELADRFFAPSETDVLRALPQERRLQAFLNLWSCKEAVLKAHGSGIAFGLHRLTFEMNAAGDVLRLAAIDSAAGESSQWHLMRVAPLPESTGALAWRGDVKAVRTFTSARA